MPSSAAKGNRTRKTLSFFRVNFGHNPPYEVLCDGPTIFQSLKNDLYLKQALPKLLGGPAYPVVTECVVNELRILGDAYSNAALFAKRVKRVSCVHEGKVTVAECLSSRLRNLPDNKLLLATIDPEVVAKIARIPGIPVISIVNHSKFVLQAPSSATLSFVKESEKTKTQSLSDPDRALVDQIHAAEELLLEKRLVRKKRKRAKGPNPLSVKKAKTNRAKGNGNPHQRSSLVLGSAVSLDTAPVLENACNGVVDHSASKRTSNKADTDAHCADTEEEKRKRNRRENVGGCEISDLNVKKSLKGTDESQKKTTSGSFKTPEFSRKRRRKNTVGKDGNAVATKMTKDLSERMNPHAVDLREGRTLISKDSQGNVAGEVQRRAAHGPSIRTPEGKEGASSNPSASVAIDGRADSRNPQTQVCIEPTSRAEEPESTQHKVSEKAQRTKDSDVLEDLKENELCDAVREHENMVSSADSVQVTDMDEIQDRNVSGVETTRAGMDGKKKKKQRKNRRRRPKKSTST